MIPSIEIKKTKCALSGKKNTPTNTRGRLGRRKVHLIMDTIRYIIIAPAQNDWKNEKRNLGSRSSL